MRQRVLKNETGRGNTEQMLHETGRGNTEQMPHVRRKTHSASIEFSSAVGGRAVSAKERRRRILKKSSSLGQQSTSDQRCEKRRAYHIHRVDVGFSDSVFSLKQPTCVLLVSCDVRFKMPPTISMHVKIDYGGVESLMERIADKEGREDGRASKTETRRGVFTEPAPTKLYRTVKKSKAANEACGRQRTVRQLRTRRRAHLWRQMDCCI